MAKQALAVVLAPLLMGCLATDICTDANLSSDREPLGTNLLQIVAATDDMEDPAYAYQNGPRVDNDFTQCSVWFGTLEEAKSMCDDAGDCRALHDWNCDGNNWRYCNVTASAMESAGNGTEACTMIKMEPTLAPTPTTATAIGDPHLKNIKQESFEIRRAGVHTLLTVPRGAAAVDTLLKVGASVERVESGCSSLFIQSLDIMGQWLGSVPPLRFAAGIVLPGEVDGAVLQVGNSSALSIDEFLSKVPSSMITLTVPKKDIAVPNATNKHATLMRAALKFGPGVSMKVSWTSERIPSASIAHSLWVSVAGLSTAHSTFGGLLGEDDHRDAATPDADCTEKGRSGMLLLGGKHESPEVAQASLE